MVKKYLHPLLKCIMLRYSSLRHVALDITITLCQCYKIRTEFWTKANIVKKNYKITGVST